MKLKGTQEIDNILNTFLQPYDCKVELGLDFAYFYTTNTIMYSFVVSENMNDFFLDFVHSLNPKLHCDIFLLSFCHELGHEETLDELSDEESHFCEEEKRQINIDYQQAKTKEEKRKIANRYFNLIDERLATEWAINYIMNNQEIITNLWNKLQPAIMNVYKENEVLI